MSEWMNEWMDEYLHVLPLKQWTLLHVSWAMQDRGGASFLTPMLLFINLHIAFTFFGHDIALLTMFILLQLKPSGLTNNTLKIYIPSFCSCITTVYFFGSWAVFLLMLLIFNLSFAHPSNRHTFIWTRMWNFQINIYTSTSLLSTNLRKEAEYSFLNWALE